MASPEPITPSKRLRSAAIAERERLRRDLGKAERRIAALRHELLEVEERAATIRRQLALLARVAHDQEADSAFPVPQLRAVASNGDAPTPAQLTPPHGYLAGAEIRMVAVQILASTANPSRPIHHKDWYGLVLDAGYGIAGRDPVATFLTQIGRSPIVRRTGERGVYALDLDAPQRLHERLEALHQELVALHEGQQTIEEIATVRERRAELTAQCARLERALEESMRALGVEREVVPTADRSNGAPQQ
jgi:septal ring factor EnvC (AmiA/AmiB activator)